MNGVKKKVMVAMSGGVDSSVAAALLKQQGWQVTGITIKLWPKYIEPEAEGGCCSLSAVEDARRVANKLDIPYYVLNMQAEFQQTVIDPFVDEYARGRTPNPCIQCNKAIKFGLLLDKADQLGMDFVATGHYARVQKGADGQYRLYRAADPDKDQSYTLYVLGQHQLRRIIFPLGEYSKEQVRTLAKEMGLAVATKPESQEICFIPDDDYKAFLVEHAGLPPRPGPIVDTAGNELGRHSGVFNFTIGQRKGLGLAVGRPLYVVDIRPETNTVVVGENKDVFNRACSVKQFSWIAGTPPAPRFRAQVMVRYNARAEPAEVVAGSSHVAVFFDSPQRAITPGQSAVVYQGEEVLGGGIIAGREE